MAGLFISTKRLYESGVKRDLAEFVKKNATQNMIFLPIYVGGK